MVVTFKPIVVQGNRRRDGTWAVYIRLTFKGVSRRIPTNLAATAADLTRTGRIKSADLLEKANSLVSRMRAALQDLTLFELESWDADRVVGRIRERLGAETFRLDFFAWADKYIKGKTPSTRRTYDQALGALERYLGRRELDVNAITRSLLLGFVDYVNTEPKIHTGRPGEWAPTERAKIPGAAAARHVQKLGHIFRAARDRYNDEDSGAILIQRSPFDTLRLPVPVSTGGQRSIGAEAMQRVILARPEDRKDQIALAAFVVSFCTMGANLADLWAAAPPSGDVWTYNRQKTRERRADGAQMRVTIKDPALPFIALLRDATRQNGALWLPGLRELASTKDICTTKVNARLRAWADREGLPGFTFYAARHTWATLARRAGVEKATVDECLGHVGDFALTDIYAERSWELLDAANDKVLALFDWPTP
jgi:integrase